MPQVVGEPGEIEGFLDGHGQAVQRPPGLAAAEHLIGLARALARGLEVGPDDRIQRGIEALHPREVMLQQLDAADFPAAQLAGQLMGRQIGDVGQVGFPSPERLTA